MPTIAVPNLEEIIAHMVSHCKKQTILIVDNTCRSIYFQPVSQIFGKFSKVSLIVFESLNKYHQFGMDRVTGGIIWCLGGDTGKISNYRVHTGTNIPDFSAASLPTPNRQLLSRKLQRHGRNATFIASSLSKWIAEHPMGHIKAVIHPQLSSHPSYQWTKTYPFSGSFISLQFEKKYQTISK
jgi:cystathionine beta-lyase/cystathionine gamma-synthase